METRLQFDMLPQPDATTCGPTCLHAVYRYFGSECALTEVIAEAPRLDEGGTLAVLLGCHALRTGFDAKIYTFNLQVFDPTWFKPTSAPLSQKIWAQMQAKESPKLQTASRAYLEFLDRGGMLKMEDLTASLIRKYLKNSVPILTGLSATYLYREAREWGPRYVPDDVRGVPAGHFVVLCGYDSETREVLIADPLMPNPLATDHLYILPIERVICAILLGILTYDANLLIVEPRKLRERKPRAHSDRRE